MWLRLRKSIQKTIFLEWEIRVVVQHRKTLRPRTIPVTVSAVWNHQDWVDSKRTGFWNVAKSKTINEAAFRTLNFELYMKPNKPIMIFGLATMTFITSYFAYTQATTGTERGSTPKNLSGMIYPREWSPKMTSFLTYSHVFLDTSDKHFLQTGLFGKRIICGFTGSFSL